MARQGGHLWTHTPRQMETQRGKQGVVFGGMPEEIQYLLTERDKLAEVPFNMDGG